MEELKAEAKEKELAECRNSDLTRYMVLYDCSFLHCFKHAFLVHYSESSDLSSVLVVDISYPVKDREYKSVGH